MKIPDHPAASSAEEWLKLAGGAKIVVLAAGVTLLGTLIYVLLLPSLTGLDDYRLLGPAFLIPVSIAALLLVWRHHAVAGFHVLLWGVLTGVTVASLIVAGLRTSIVFAYPAVIIAAMALGPRIVVLVGSTAIAAVIGMGLAEHFALLPGPRLPSTFVIGLTYTLVLLVLTAFATAMVREQKRWRDKAAEASHALEQGLQALRESEARFRHLFEQVPSVAVQGYAIDGTVIFWNKANESVYGYTKEEVLGRNFLDLIIPPPMREDVRAAVKRMADTGQGLPSEELLLMRKDGSPVPVFSSHVVLENAAGQKELYCLDVDLTERKKTEAILQESEERLREAQRIGRVGSWDLDIANKRIAFSPELHHIYERESGAFGDSFEGMLKLMHPDDLPKIRQAWHDSAKVKGSYEMEHRILTPDGRVKYLHVRWEVFRDDAGRPARALGTAQDITEQVLARAEIGRLNERLEARVRERTAELQAANKELESFAYSISHDLRAPLRGIDGFSLMAIEEYGDKLDEQGRGYLERVRAAAQRMGALIDDILELSRITRHSMRRGQVDLSRLAKEILEEQAHSAPERAVEVAIAADCAAFGDPQLLRVMLQNLLENAWKYSGKEVAPRIEFGRETQDGEQAFFVRDNGVGFDMKYADRLFAPFQRLHRPEEFAGTGIGLATVARIVHRHGGRVWAESAPGQGTTLRFTLGPSSAKGQ